MRAILITLDFLILICFNYIVSSTKNPNLGRFEMEQHENIFKSRIIDSLLRQAKMHRLCWKMVQVAVAMFAIGAVAHVVVVGIRETGSFMHLLNETGARAYAMIIMSGVMVLSMIILLSLDKNWHTPWMKQWRESYYTECRRIAKKKHRQMDREKLQMTMKDQLRRDELAIKNTLLLRLAFMTLTNPGSDFKH
ncbi:MAG: hypothetical protein ABH832_02575 [bacterium]